MPLSPRVGPRLALRSSSGCRVRAGTCAFGRAKRISPRGRRRGCVVDGRPAQRDGAGGLADESPTHGITGICTSRMRRETEGWGLFTVTGAPESSYVPTTSARRRKDTRVPHRTLGAPPPCTPGSPHASRPVSRGFRSRRSGSCPVEQDRFVPDPGFRYIAATPNLRPGRHAHSRGVAGDFAAAMHDPVPGRRAFGPFTLVRYVP